MKYGRIINILLVIGVLIVQPLQPGHHLFSPGFPGRTLLFSLASSQVGYMLIGGTLCSKARRRTFAPCSSTTNGTSLENRGSGGGLTTQQQQQQQQMKQRTNWSIIDQEVQREKERKTLGCCCQLCFSFRCVHFNHEARGAVGQSRIVYSFAQNFKLNLRDKWHNSAGLNFLY